MPTNSPIPGYDKLTQLFRAIPSTRPELDPDIGDDETENEVKFRQAQPRGIQHPQIEPLTDTPGGYMQPSLPPGLPWIVGTGPNNPIAKEHRFPVPPKLWQKAVFPGGTLNPMLECGFPVQSVRIDNWTSQYLLVRGPEVYVPPYTYGVTVKMYNNPQTIEFLWEAPPGFTNPAVNLATAVHIWALEDEGEYNPGALAPNHP